jgi:hypothetical protein
MVLLASHLLLPLLMVLSQDRPGAHAWMAGAEGMWKGTSLCQIKESPCHDEVVVYHVSRGAAEDRVVITMNKVVEGKEEEMGSVDCVDGGGRGVLTCNTDGRGVWSFTLAGDAMTGTLMYRGQLYRRIEAQRAKETTGPPK